MLGPISEGSSQTNLNSALGAGGPRAESNIEDTTNSPTKSFLQKVSEFATAKILLKGFLVALVAYTVVVFLIFTPGPGLLFLAGICLALYIRHILLDSQSTLRIEFSPTPTV